MRARPTRLIAVVVALMIVLGACDVELQVDIDVAEDGSGLVTAAIGLDPEARSRIGGVDAALRLEDLEATGWEVALPEIRDDGLRWWAVSKPFANPGQLQDVLDELVGPGSAFRRFAIERSSSRDENVIRVTGIVDLERGIDLFGDEQLAALIENPPLGVALEELEAEIGPIEEAVVMRVVVRLPGEEEGQTFVVPLGGQADIEAEITDENQWGRVLRWAGWALLALFGLSVVLAAVGWLLDRRYARYAPPRRPEPVRERVPAAPVKEVRAQPSGQPRLQLVVLDGHGVVFSGPSEPERWLAAFAHDRGSVAPPDEIAELYRELTLGRLTTAELWTELGVVGEPADLDAAYLTAYRFESAAREFLREMRRRSLPVAVVSNDALEWSYDLQDIHGLSWVDHWVVSAEIGVRAPDPAFFEAVRRAADVPYERSLAIMSTVPPLDTARSLGMITALLGDEPPAEGDAASHPVVTDFSDFFRRRQHPASSGARRRR